MDARLVSLPANSSESFSLLLLLKQVKEIEERLEKQGGSIGSLLHQKVCFLSVLVGFFLLYCKYLSKNQPHNLISDSRA